LKPDYAEAWNNLALVWKNIGEYERALDGFNHAVDLSPRLSVARWNRSFVHLLKENYELGWYDYLWRFAIPHWRTIYPFRIQGKRWDGSISPGQRILVHDEQGLGDTLQFVRYLPLLSQRCGKVILETREELIEVLQTVEGIDELISRSANGQPKVSFDAYVPLLTLPYFFKTTRINIPNHVPYVFADPAKTAQWRRQYPGRRPKVGLMWAGSPHHTNDRNRSMAIADLMPLLQTPGIDFIGLQKGPAGEQLDKLPSGIRLINTGDQLRNFSDTAACLSNLDLLITVDTAVAHLAGAMGLGVWLMLPFIPDWRWGIDSSVTAWYPSMKLFRQPRLKDWSPVINQIRHELYAKFNLFDSLNGNGR